MITVANLRMQQLILASASPQRKAILHGLGVAFDVSPSSVDEDRHPEQSPQDRAVILARLKAQDIAARAKDAFVIGCDTLVAAADGTLLEKPRDEHDARRMMRLHSGATSLVYSALCIVDPEGTAHEGVSISNVTFKKLTDADIDWWLRKGLWRDRSGAFQIDGQGQMLISRLEGDWTGVVGLPVFLLGELLREASYRFE